MSELTATLPIYDLPEMAGANAALWAAISARLARTDAGERPAGLSAARPSVPDEIGPATFFSQTCGYPLLTLYPGQFQLLGVPTYDVPGCGPGDHCAVLIVREDSRFQAPADLRGASFAINGRHSNTGMNLPRLLFARIAGGRPFFREVRETGSHRASLASVLSGEADSASIDCVTYAFVRKYHPDEVAGLRMVADTPRSPAIPFVTSIRTRPERVAALRDALCSLGDDPAGRAALDGLRIRSIDPVELATYAVLEAYEREAAALGYPVLA